MATENPELVTERDGVIGWITVNRPSAHNALNRQVWTELAAAVDAFGGDESVRVIAIRGSGGRAFISGADIREFDEARGDPGAARSYDELSETTWRALERVRVPVIAMVNGLCYGGGVSIAASCDLRIAGESARFAIPALRLGLAYPLAAVERLVRIVGSAAASDLLLTGRAVSADEAQRLGLVHRVVADNELESAVREIAEQIGSGAPRTLAAHKLAIREAVEARADRDWAGLERALRRCFESDDYREGVRAFLEKRAPRFTGD
jgi:enoyl-CoA hydratase/carnithine racemase